jgi:energy-coupling factor transport system permease protein
MRGRRPSAHRALQFRQGSSPLHGLGWGPKSVLAALASALALSTHSIPALLLLAAGVATGYRLAQLRAADLWRDLRWVLVQGLLVALLTVAFAGSDALGRGVRTALQLMLVFLPAALVLRTTSSDSLLSSVERWLPSHLAFAAGATLRFVPVFTREAGELIEMQRLRGARLSPGDLWRPGAWHDWLRCVAFPMTVRSVEVAKLAAEAAEMRGVGRTADRRAQRARPR